MTEFYFLFEARTAKPHDQYTKHVGGVYNWCLDEIKIFLPSIANAFTFWIPGFMHKFKPSYQRMVENNIRKQTCVSINHEYMHKALGTTECPLDQQHFAIETIEDLEEKD